MPLYNFKAIKVVPSGKDFQDIVLSKTQRQTPTVVHNGWAITRIRSFYMRKVKFTQSTWHDKLTQILEDFPQVDSIHPFYADLLNVLYDRDHYKLALGQLKTARSLIDRVAQDYVRLLKYGDSLYRCKELKRAALGRMCTIMKKQTASLAYLEQVRQHMSRLPAIDPNTRTLLVCGYPNVGKSSFMNRITRADVDVQPYAFTTKSLFVGHTDHQYLRWQVIDTPGILDRPLEERNTIEMQSITALAHLRAAVLYVIDISEQCGYTIAQQAALFQSIRPLFANKPLLVVANKIDVAPMDTLSEEDRKLLEEMRLEAAKTSVGGSLAPGAEAPPLLTMSTLTEAGVMAVKQEACERLLSSRVEVKMQGKRINDVLNRMHVATPQPRDGAARPPVIPPGVAAARGLPVAGQAPTKQTEKDLQEANGGAGVYSADLRKSYLLRDPAWKHDLVPEIMDGHNVLDFVDPDIDAKLAALEKEEEALATAALLEGLEMEGDEDALTVEERATLKRIRARRKVVVAAHRRRKSTANNQAVLPHAADPDRKLTTANMKAAMSRVGIDPTRAVDRARALSRGRKRIRSASAAPAAAADGDVDMADAEPPKKRLHSSKSRSMSRGRTLSVAPHKPGSGLKDSVQRNKALKLGDRAQRRAGKAARRGEGDRHVPDLKPKHLFSGKRPKGKTDRR